MSKDKNKDFGPDPDPIGTAEGNDEENKGHRPQGADAIPVDHAINLSVDHQLTGFELVEAIEEFNGDLPVFVARDGQIAQIIRIVDKSGQPDEHKRQIWLVIGQWKPAP